MELKIPVIYQDNMSTISLVTKADGGKMRTKHMRARRAAVLNDVVENKLFRVVYVNTKDMLADVLTKPLGGSQFDRLMSYLMGTADPTDYSVVMHASRTGVRWSNVHVGDTYKTKNRPGGRKDEHVVMTIQERSRTSGMVVRW